MQTKLQLKQSEVAAIGTFAPPPAEVAAPASEPISQTVEILPAAIKFDGDMILGRAKFDLPEGKKLVAISLQVTRKADFPEGVSLYDSHLCFSLDGRAIGDNFQSPMPWLAGESTHCYANDVDPSFGCKKVTSKQLNDGLLGVIHRVGYRAESEVDSDIDAQILKYSITVTVR